MKNLRNIDLRSVRAAELHSAADHHWAATMHEDSGQTARWAHRQDAYGPISTNSHEHGQTNSARHPEVAAANEGPLLRGHRHSSHVENIVRESAHAREVPHFVRNDGRKEE
jgi:hypothetical protein